MSRKALSVTSEHDSEFAVHYPNAVERLRDPSLYQPKYFHVFDDETDEKDLLMTEEEKNCFAAQLSEWEALRAGKGVHHVQSVPNANRGKRTMDDSQGFIARSENWQQRRSEAYRSRQIDGQDKELKECTFSPKISHHSRSLKNNMPATHRLFTDGVRRQQELQAARDGALQELSDQCPFVPRTCKKPWMRDVAPRYLDSYADPVEKPKPESDANCTFTPVVNEVDRVRSQYASSAKLVKSYCAFDPLNHDPDIDLVSSYLRVPVHERLAENARERRERAVSTQKAAEQHRQSEARPMVNKHDISSTFAERLLADRQRRERHQESLANESRSATPFTPRTNRKYNNYVKSSFERPVSRRQTEPDEDSLECTFKPTINQTSTSSRYQQVKEAQIRRELQESALRKELEQERELKELGIENESCTLFRPSISKRSRDLAGKKKRLGDILHLDPSDYVSQVAAIQSRRDREVESAKLEQLREEEAALTFHPRIHTVPPQIRKVASLHREYKTKELIDIQPPPMRF